MTTVTGDFYLVIYRNWDFQICLHQAADNINRDYIKRGLSVCYEKKYCACSLNGSQIMKSNIYCPIVPEQFTQPPVNVIIWLVLSISCDPKLIQIKSRNMFKHFQEK